MKLFKQPFATLVSDFYEDAQCEPVDEVLRGIICSVSNRASPQET